MDVSYLVIYFQYFAIKNNDTLTNLEHTLPFYMQAQTHHIENHIKNNLKQGLFGLATVISVFILYRFLSLLWIHFIPLVLPICAHHHPLFFLLLRLPAASPTRIDTL